MEHETSQNLIKVELTVKQLTSILINFDYLNKLAKERGKSLIAIKYSNDIEPFKKALNYTLDEDPRQFSAEECDLLYWANKFVNDPDAAKKIDEFFSYFNSANDTEPDRAPKIGLVERFNFGLLPRFNLSLVARFNFGLPNII